MQQPPSATGDDTPNLGATASSSSSDVEVGMSNTKRSNASSQQSQSPHSPMSIAPHDGMFDPKKKPFKWPSTFFLMFFPIFILILAREGEGLHSLRAALIFGFSFMTFRCLFDFWTVYSVAAERSTRVRLEQQRLEQQRSWRCTTK
jgi:hypothetical protein